MNKKNTSSTKSNGKTLKNDKTENTDEIKKIKEENLELKSQVEDYKNQLLRSIAETENTRKRYQKEKASSIKYANQDIALDLLPILDNMDRALTSLDQDKNKKLINSYVEGLSMMKTEFEKTLQKHSILEVKAQDQPFNPDLHQAVFEVEKETEPGIIIDVIQKGYTLHDRLLRASMVGVSKKKKT